MFALKHVTADQPKLGLLYLPFRHTLFFHVGTDGERQGDVLCGGHKTEGMININTKRCSYKGCHKYPSYALETGNIRERCAKHAEDGMISTHRTCATQGCGTTPNYGRDGFRTHCVSCFRNSVDDGRTLESTPVPDEEEKHLSLVDVAKKALLADMAKRERGKEMQTKAHVVDTVEGRAGVQGEGEGGAEAAEAAEVAAAAAGEVGRGRALVIDTSPAPASAVPPAPVAPSPAPAPAPAALQGDGGISSSSGGKANNFLETADCSGTGAASSEGGSALQCMGSASLLQGLAAVAVRLSAGEQTK